MTSSADIPTEAGEKKADFYMRPVYQFYPCVDKKAWKEKLYETYKMIQDKTLKLYLVSGAAKEEMYGEKSYIKNMDQEETQYRCLKIRDAGDMRRIAGIIWEKYAELGGGEDGAEDQSADQ